MPGKHSQKTNNKIIVEMSLSFVIKTKSSVLGAKNIQRWILWHFSASYHVGLKKCAKYQAKLNIRRIKYGLVYLING